MSIFKKWATAILTTLAVVFLFGVGVTAKAATYNAMDFSEWQGSFTASEVQKLKTEANFYVLRVQYGSAYSDKVFAHNAALFNKYDVPFGVYSFSQYLNPTDAKSEALSLYNRSKAYSPKFYVNDYESQTVTSGGTNASTKAWYTELNSLTTKPIVFYSYRSFLNSYASTSYSSYDALWLAGYSTVTPTPKNYALWQNSDSYYSTSLGQSVDHSIVMTNQKPLSFWIGTSAADTVKSKYTEGGFKVGQKVTLSTKATKWYSPRAAIPDSSKGLTYTISATRSVNMSKSNQAVTLTRNGVVVGIALAQDVSKVSTYVRTNPHYVFSKTNVNEYKDVSLSNKVASHSKGTVFKVKSVVTYKNGTRLLLTNGNYISGNTDFVNNLYYKATSTSNEVKQVKSATKVSRYKDLAFTKKVDTYAKGTAFDISSVVKYGNVTRLKLSNGYYISANKQINKFVK